MHGGRQWATGFALLLGALIWPQGMVAAQEAGRGGLVIAQAGTSSPAATGRDGWQFTLAPLYLWAPSLDAKLSVGPLSRSTDISFGDVLENFDFGFTAHFEATRGAWTALADIMYLELGKGETVRGVRVDVDIQQLFFEFGGTYRLGAVPVGQTGRLTFEALAGARLIAMDVDLGVARQQASRSATLIDPMVGGRIAYHITDTVSIWVRGDLAGFGISDAQTELTWNLIAGINWRLSPRTSAFAGWRVMDIDVEKGSGRRTLDVDLTLSGPLLGLNLYF